MKKKLIYVLGGYIYENYADWILPLGFKLTSNPKEADVLLFAGGADVNPIYYNDECGVYTNYDNQRDIYEINVFNFFPDKKKLGICRGHQLLSVLSFPKKAKLIQHSIHPHFHPIKTFDKQELIFNSLHHQQVLFENKYTGLKEGLDYKLFGWADNISEIHWGGDDKNYDLPNDYKEIEISYIPKTKVLSFQNHPEMMLYSRKNKEVSRTINFCEKLFLDFMDDNL